MTNEIITTAINTPNLHEVLRTVTILVLSGLLGMVCDMTNITKHPLFYWWLGVISGMIAVGG